MEMILLAAGCYTVTSLSDKYAASTAKFSGVEVTFLMAAATSVFMTLLLPLLGIPFSPFSWQLLLALFLIGCIRGENRRGIAGAVISILGIVGFQFLK